VGVFESFLEGWRARKAFDALKRFVELHAVCRTCVLPTDTVMHPSGDFGLCARCQTSITSADGVMVRYGIGAAR
jgi:hypothetical protein